MNKERILLTGATGFLGSHMAEQLLKDGCEISALKRKQSNFWRCEDFINQINWLEWEDSQVDRKIKDFKPDILIHFAWEGVSASERNIWDKQINNIELTYKILKYSQESGISKFICIGSQAEYGQFSGRINEKANCQPVCAYGSTKLATSKLIETYCNQHSIDWYWLRQFSVFGPKEEPIWVLSSAIINLLQNKEMLLTGCEQKYDYIYVRDFVNAICKIIENKGNSGIYNLSSNKSVPLSYMLEKIRKQITNDQSLLKYGALSYRPKQVMHMEGDSTLFFETFDFKINSDLDLNIYETIEYYNHYFLNK